MIRVAATATAVGLDDVELVGALRAVRHGPERGPGADRRLGDEAAFGIERWLGPGTLEIGVDGGDQAAATFRRFRILARRDAQPRAVVGERPALTQDVRELPAAEVAASRLVRTI